ncbi:MAG: hypothetical protein KKA05_06000 [Alphaproteobacteria bacterium]|nr:hypothetical protein [Alphaproteobacteria bacterium]MBU0859307.1 hypothetical protein [Alphaproteobacteria bacterium]
MTISVYFIEGSRKNACRHDAFSIVRNERELLDIIPCAALKKGQDSTALAAAFTRVVQDNPAAPAETIKRTARQTLGLHCA